MGLREIFSGRFRRLPEPEQSFVQPETTGAVPSVSVVDKRPKFILPPSDLVVPSKPTETVLWIVRQERSDIEQHVVTMPKQPQV